MKYLEQRVEDLEKELQELKIRLFQKEFKETKKCWEGNAAESNISADYLYNSNLASSAFLDDHPPYPNIWDSWENNPLDVIEETPEDYKKFLKDLEIRATA